MKPHGHKLGEGDPLPAGYAFSQREVKGINTQCAVIQAAGAAEWHERTDPFQEVFQCPLVFLWQWKYPRCWLLLSAFFPFFLVF